MSFAKLRRPAGWPIWINEHGVVLREPDRSELRNWDYDGEVTVVEPAGYIVRGAPEEIAQVMDNDRD